MRVATIRSRIAALFLDGLLFLPLAIWMEYVFIRDQWEFVDWVLPELFFYIGFSTFFVHRYGGSPGKLMMKLQIVDSHGHRLGLLRSFLRNVPFLLLSLAECWLLILERAEYSAAEFEAMNSWEKWNADDLPNSLEYNVLAISLILGLSANFIAVTMNHRRRALHDFLAGSLVIYDPMYEV